MRPTRRPRVVVPAVVLVVLAAASGRWAASAPPPDELVRVATYNIHKGADRRGHYDLERTIDAIHRLGAHVVGVQEAMRNHPAANCDDQPALIAEGLRRRTGERWAHVYVKAWINGDRRCMEQGRGDDVETEGFALLAARRVGSWTSVRLGEGRIGVVVRLASMPDIPIVGTHLSPNRQNQAERVREIVTLLPWARRHGPGLLIGDLNAEPDASELAPILEHYRDAWAEAAGRGQAHGVASGATRPNGRSRIDYVLYAPAAPLALESVEVVDTRTLGLGEVSDHHPVVATFRRAPRP